VAGGLVEHFQRITINTAPSGTYFGGNLSGRGTWYLAARNQDVFTVALPMAGRPQPDSVDVEWKIPLYVIHSRDDEVVPYEDAERVVRELKNKAATIEFVLLEGITHHETERCVQSLREAVPWIRKAWERR
jgi:predicted peptidase